MRPEEHRARDRGEEPRKEARDALLAVEGEEVEERAHEDSRDFAVQFIQRHHLVERNTVERERSRGGGKRRDSEVGWVEDVTLQKRDGKLLRVGAVEFMAEVPEVCDDNRLWLKIAQRLTSYGSSLTLAQVSRDNSGHRPPVEDCLADFSPN